MPPTLNRCWKPRTITLVPSPPKLAMSPTTSTASSFYSITESLPAHTNWDALHKTLEQRLSAVHAGVERMTIPERQLLGGLRLRARLLPIPFYARQDQRGPHWWIALKGSEGATLA